MFYLIVFITIFIMIETLYFKKFELLKYKYVIGPLLSIINMLYYHDILIDMLLHVITINVIAYFIAKNSDKILDIKISNSVFDNQRLNLLDQKNLLLIEKEILLKKIQLINIKKNNIKELIESEKINFENRKTALQNEYNNKIKTLYETQSRAILIEFIQKHFLEIENDNEISLEIQNQFNNFISK